MKFHNGYIGGWTTEERIFILSFIRLAKPNTDVEKIMLKRFITRMMGHPIFHLPLHPKRECPICEYTFTRGYERHVIACRVKKKENNRKHKIDPVVLEMLGLH